VSFEVEHVEVNRFGTTVGDLADDAGMAVGYATGQLGIGYAEGRMFATVVEKATEVREAMERNYGTLKTLVTTAGQELTKAATYYQNTDHAEAARIDRTYQ
jgi:hypothetical protein